MSTGKIAIMTMFVAIAVAGSGICFIPRGYRARLSDSTYSQRASGDYARTDSCTYDCVYDGACSLINRYGITLLHFLAV